MICVALLQKFTGVVESEAGFCSDTSVMCEVDGNAEVSIKVEEAIDT